MEDASALAKAFSGAKAVFILPPSEFDPEPGYPEAQAVIDSVVAALTAAKTAKVLALSTIGADAVHDNLLSQRTMLEAALRALREGGQFLEAGQQWKSAVDAAGRVPRGECRRCPGVPQRC